MRNASAPRRPGGQPPAAAPPPPTPEQVIQARKPRPPWPTWALGLGLILVVGHSMAGSLKPATRQQAQLLAIVHTWAVPVGSALLTVGVIALIVQVSFEPRGAAAVRVLSAAGKGLKLGPNQVTLGKPRWKATWKRGRRIRRLASGRIRYATGWVSTDMSADLEEILEPFAAGPLHVTWEPDHDRFSVTIQPPAPVLLQDTSTTVGAMTRTLSHLMGELEVDQVQTQISSRGAITQFVAQYARTTRDLADSYRQRIKYVLDAKCPCPTGYWNVRLDPETSRITVMPSEPMPTKAELPLTELTTDDRLKIPVGVAAGGEIVYWYPAIFPHMLLAGITGTGKTIFINSLVVLCTARGWLVTLVDPKEVSYRGYIPDTLRRLGRRLWAGIRRVATVELEMEEAIHEEYEELRRRYAALKVFGVRERDLQPRLLIVDEAGEMTERLNSWQSSDAKYFALVEQATAKAEAEGADPIAAAKLVDKPKGSRNPVLLELWSLLRLGRQALQFVVTGTQRPDVNFIPGEARSNHTAKVGMGKLDGAAMDMLFGTRLIQQRVHDTTVDPITGERKFTRIRGRATIDVGDGPVSVQTFWTPEPGKVISGELDESDTALVGRQHDYVTKWAPTWDINSEWTGFEEPAPKDIVDRKTTMVTAALDADLHKEPPKPKKKPRDTGRPAGSLAAGDVATLEIDGEQVSVEITEIEDDPSWMGEEGEVHELQLTYRFAEGTDRAGQIGVTTLADDERIAVES